MRTKPRSMRYSCHLSNHQAKSNTSILEIKPDVDKMHTKVHRDTDSNSISDHNINKWWKII